MTTLTLTEGQAEGLVFDKINDADDVVFLRQVVAVAFVRYMAHGQTLKALNDEIARHAECMPHMPRVKFDVGDDE